ncbi:MAG: calcium-binding EGF-like domain-containing protein, partial [Actinomycetota bacterium]|nr:calcium-binding EGF-like domain-containing protein [Actinomycetota bacterium]
MNGQHEVPIAFDAVLATGIRLEVIDTSAGNENVVLTELSVFGAAEADCVVSNCPEGRDNWALASNGGSVEASANQGGYHVSASIDGTVTGAGNGWAFGGGASRSDLKVAIYTLGTRAVLDQINVISGIDRDDHMISGFQLFYTNDDTVSAGSTWVAMNNIVALDPVAGLSITENEVVASGQHYVRLSFEPTAATGIKIELFDTNAGNDNVVLTELMAIGYAVGCEVCAEVDCGENGRCNPLTGSCLCTDGWSGEVCDVGPVCPRQNYAAATSGGSVEASANQGGYHISESIDGALAPADNGWAFGGGASASDPRIGVYSFAGPAFIDSMSLLSGVGRGDHHLAGINLFYTTDDSPSVDSGSWEPLTNVHFLVSVGGGDISENTVRMNGQHEVPIAFDAVLATGIRLEVIDTSAGNE